MDPVTVGLLVLGCAGALVLAASLVFGEVLHVHADVHADIDADGDGDGPFSIPVITAFFGAFGFVGAIGHTMAGGGTGTGALLAAGVAGLAGALPTAWLTVRLIRMLSRMPTDGTLTASALVASSGVVVTPINTGAFGEVQVTVGGQPLKLYAKADRALPLGTAVFVVEALTESSVIVVEAHGSH